MMFSFLLACSGCAVGFLVQASFILVGIWFLFAMLVGLRRPLASQSTCFQCGYDLDGLPEGAGCPECGVPHAGRERSAGGPRWHPQTLPMLRLALWASLFLIAFGVLTARPLLQIAYDIRYGPGRINAANVGEGVNVFFPVLFAMFMPFAAGVPRPSAPRFILALTIIACVLHVFTYTGFAWLAAQ